MIFAVYLIFFDVYSAKINIIFDKTKSKAIH